MRKIDGWRDWEETMSKDAEKRERDWCNGRLESDYINRRAVLDMLAVNGGSYGEFKYIFSLPGINKTKRGKWILDDEFIDCSVCRRNKWSRLPYEALVSRFRYCPRCGAQLREDDDAED